jgi:hypothetical protein
VTLLIVRVWAVGMIAWLYVMLVVHHVKKERKIAAGRSRVLAWASPAWPLLLLVHFARCFHALVVDVVEDVVKVREGPPEYGKEGWVAPQEASLRCTGPGCSNRLVVAYDTRTGSALCDDCLEKRPDVREAIERWIERRKARRSSASGKD